MNLLKLIKGLFAAGSKLAHVVRCKNCKSEFWDKKRSRLPPYNFYNPKDVCPNCESTSSLFIPSDISVTQREKMYRFLDDAEKQRRLDLEHDELMEERIDVDMGYDGHWGNVNPGFLHEISEKIKENLR